VGCEDCTALPPRVMRSYDAVSPSASLRCIFTRINHIIATALPDCTLIQMIHILDISAVHRI